MEGGKLNFYEVRDISLLTRAASLAGLNPFAKAFNTVDWSRRNDKIR